MSDFISALKVLTQPYCLAMMLVGGIIGLVLGAIPGLSGALAITIILPLTFAMDSNVAIALLISIWIGSCSGGFIGSVLLGIQTRLHSAGLRCGEFGCFLLSILGLGAPWG